MTKKEIFDKVSAHLIKQNKKSYLSKEIIEKMPPNFGIDCAYRGEDNCACAIGCLIPNNEYLVEMEGCVPAALKFKNQELQGSFKEHYQLLFKLQCIHDFHPPAEWKKLLKELKKDVL